MKTLKILLFVISLLGVGFLSGFYSHRYVVNKKIEKVAEMRFARGFSKNLFERIGVDEEQKKQMAPIVNKYAQQMAKISKDSRLKRKELIDSLHEDLKPLMTKTQIEQMDAFSRRFRQKEREWKDRKMKKRRPQPENIAQ